MEHANGLVLQSLEGEHLGFCLANPDFRGKSGDCVFLLVPVNAEVFDTTIGQLCSRLQFEGEHQWQKKDENIQILDSSKQSVLTVLPSGKVLDADGLAIGRASPLPE